MNGRVVLVNKLTSLHLLAENKNWGEKISENFPWNACISKNLCVTLHQKNEYLYEIHDDSYFFCLYYEFFYFF